MKMVLKAYLKNSGKWVIPLDGGEDEDTLEVIAEDSISNIVEWDYEIVD